MSNMSYCRFQNTAQDLHDCELTLRDMQDGSERPLGREELEAARRLVASCVNIIQGLADFEGTAIVDLDDYNSNHIAVALEKLNERSAECNEDEEDE